MAKKHKMLNPTIAEIYHAIEKNASDWRRDHLGCSGLGRECERQIWYNWRWYAKPQFDGRIFRLFRRGHLEEEQLELDLVAAGITVSTGPSKGEQWRASALWGHLGGSMDFALLGLPEMPSVWHLGEAKTHNKKSFDELEKKGVQKSKPVHYAQTIIYMELFGLTYAAYLAVCKDDDRLYLERYRADKYYAGELLEKAERIIRSTEEPARISDRPDYYLCRWCDFYNVCHGIEKPRKSCRSCRYGKPVLEGDGGRWSCKQWGRELNSEDQRRACEKYSQTGSPALPILGG